MPHYLVSQQNLLRPFRRVTASTSFIPQVDGIRCLAILAVIVVHLRNYVAIKTPVVFETSLQSDWAAIVSSYGNFGVSIFFALSGFILALPFAYRSFSAKPFRLRNYFLRRLTRLEPPYLILMLLLFLLLVVVNHESVKNLLPHLLASLAYLHSAIYATNSPINLVTWSLEVEVQFYLIMPLLAMVYTIRAANIRRLVLVLVVVTFLILQTLWFAREPRLALSILNYIQFFIIGMILADIYLVDWKLPTHCGALWDLLGICSWVALIFAMPHDNLRHCLSPFLVLLIFASIFRGSLTSRIFSNPWITTVGGMCYTIYLVHLHVISLVGRYSLRLFMTHSFSINLMIQTALMLPCILFVSGLLYLLLEKPCMQPNWPNELGSRLASVLTQHAPLNPRVASSKSDV